MTASMRIAIAAALALAGCAREARPVAHVPADQLELPAWARHEAQSSPRTPLQDGTKVLGSIHESSSPAAGRPASADTPSRPSGFSREPSWHGYGYGFYRPAIGNTQPGQNQSPRPGSPPPVGGDWPAIPNAGPPMPSTTPVHP